FGKLEREARKEALVLGFPRPEDDELYGPPSKDPRKRAHAEIEALLPCQSRDDSDDRHTRVIAKATALEEVALVLLFAREIVRRVVMFEPGVRLWIPLGLVDAIQNAEEHLGALPKKCVEAHAVLRRLDFAGVRGAHGGDGVGVEDAGQQEVDPSLAHLVLVEV